VTTMAGTIAGEVLFGINGIFTVLAGGCRLRCRIKGKVLATDVRAYNPIAPGDRVVVLPDPLSPHEGKITAVLPRRTCLARWNKKGRAPQVIAANADIAICVTSPESPPFRPRFVDRLIVAAEAGGLTPAIVLNKCDLGADPAVLDRLARYEGMGYRVLRCSALSREGIGGLQDLLGGMTTVFVGQSGVGKSSILNTLEPRLGLRVGWISDKHDRGSHTTIVSALFTLSTGARIIDTPGVRELELADMPPGDVAFHFREFAPHSVRCGYQPCLHAGEPGCAVAEAARGGEIHPDRYESYRRILAELRESGRHVNG